MVLVGFFKDLCSMMGTSHLSDLIVNPVKLLTVGFYAEDHVNS